MIYSIHLKNQGSEYNQTEDNFLCWQKADCTGEP